MDVKRYHRFVPAAAAAASGAAAAFVIYFNQPGSYPLRLVAVQVFILLAACLVASTSPRTRTIGVVLTFVGIVCTFSALIFYIPTAIAAAWRLASAQSTPAH
jgi:uncharacterized Tic20 family protein